MVALNVGKGAAIQTPYSPVPCGKRLTIPFEMPWDIVDVYTIDFTQAIDQKTIDSIQSFFVDNRSNLNELEILVVGTSQRLVLPGQSQAYLPVISRTQPKFEFRSTQLADQRTTILANNFPTPTHVWLF